MSLRDEIAATFQRLALDVRISGNPVQVVGVDTSAGLSQINAQAAIHVLTRPSVAEEGSACEVWALINGRAGQIFSGELSGLTWSYFPGEVSLDARDLLARARLPWGGEDRTYTTEDDADVIFNLLNAMAIPEEKMHIESSGWTLGTIQEVVAKSGQPFQPVIEEIDNLAGFKTFSRPDGVVWRQRVSPVAGPTPSFVYEQGVNIVSCKRTRGRDGIVNRVIVTGLTYESLVVGGPGVGEAQAANAFVPTPPGYITNDVQSDLVEDDAKALEIAERMVGDLNRRPESYEVVVTGNPLLQPGMTVQLIHDAVESGDATVLIDRVQHSFRGASFRTTFTTFGGNLSGTVIDNIPPAIVLNVLLDQEVEDTGSALERRIMVVADASATTDPDGDETAIDWSWSLSVDAGTIDPTTASGVGLNLVRAIISGDATILTIVLDATDAGGDTATVTRTVPIDSSTVIIEPVYSAEGVTIAATNDGGQNWGEYTIPGGAESHCCMAIGPAWGNLWGATNGHAYATFDYLATAAVDLGAPHGAVEVTAVWVHETDTTRLWLAYADGKVYFGTLDITAQTATWALRGTAPAGPIQEIRESIGALGSLRITAGNGYYGSEDGGATWNLIHDFTSQAWRMAGGWETNLASALDNDDPLYAETGTLPTLPVLSPTVRHIRGLSFGWRLPELYLADDQARLLRADDLVTVAHVDDAPAGVNHLIRSGNVDGLVYLALGDGTGGDGIAKSIRLEAPFYLRQTSTAVHMVGYGPAHAIAGAYEFLLWPTGATGADDKIWYYAAGIWTGITPPVAGWYWTGMAANPFDQDEWLLWGTSNVNHWSYRNSGNTVVYGDGTSGSTSPLWHTPDRGATWTPITLPVGSHGTAVPASDPMYMIWNFCAWDPETSGRWGLLMQTSLSTDNSTWVWIGSGATAAAATLTESVTCNWLISATAGQFITTQFGANTILCTVDTAGVPHTIPEAGGFTNNQWNWTGDTLPGASAVLWRRQAAANVWGVQDYSRPDLLVGEADIAFGLTGDSAGADYVACATHGAYVSGNNGLVKVDDPFHNGAQTTVSGHGSAFSYIRSGRRLRRAVVAISGTPTMGGLHASGDGVAWQIIAPPPVSDLSKIVLACEVLERGI